jgi:hypothetical protein
MLEQRAHAAILQNQLGGSFRPDAGRALQVVGRITDQCRVRRQLLRPESEALDDRRGVEQHRLLAARTCEPDARALVHELQHIAVTADDENALFLGMQPARERREDVIGLESGHAKSGETEASVNLRQSFELPHQVRRCARAPRLVLLEAFAAERARGCVHRKRRATRLLLAQHLEHQRTEAIQRRRRHAGRRVHHRQRMKRTKHERIGIEQSRIGARASCAFRLGRLQHRQTRARLRRRPIGRKSALSGFA